MFRFLMAIGYVLFLSNVGVVYFGGSINFLEKLLLLSASFFWVLNSVRKDFLLLSLGCFVIVFLAYLAASTEYPFFEWNVFASALNQVVILSFFLSVTPSSKDRDFLFKLLAHSAVVCLSFGLVYELIGIRSMFGQEFSTGGARLQGSLIPSYLSGVAMCSLFASLSLLYSGNRSYIYLILFNSITLVLAGGRMAIVSSAIALCGFYVFKHRQEITKKGLSAVFIIVFCVVFFSIFPEYLGRFSKSGASGRDLMWPYLIELFEAYPWTGIGFGHQFYDTPRDLVVLVGSAAAHSDYLRLLVETGVFGTAVIIFWLIFSCYRTSVLTYGEFSFVTLFGVVSVFLLMTTDNVISSTAYYPMLILSVFFQEVDRELS